MRHYFRLLATMAFSSIFTISGCGLGSLETGENQLANSGSLNSGSNGSDSDSGSSSGGDDSGGSDTSGDADTRVYSTGACDRCFSLAKSEFDPGERVLYRWHDIDAPSPDNWLGGYLATDAPNILYQDWLNKYVRNDSGIGAFLAPDTPGTYEIRLHYDEYYSGALGVEGASSLQFTVVGDIPEEVVDNRPYPTEIKNVILMIGDGMGAAHVNLTAHVTNNELVMQALDSNPASMTTSSLSGLVDSGTAATAIATGYKTSKRRVSVLYDDTVLETIVERAESIGKATGIVIGSGTRVYNATAAAFVSHVDDFSDRLEIVDQMALLDIEVILGGGYDRWIPQTSEGSDREDGRDLIQEKRDAGWTTVSDQTGLLSIPADTNRLLGLFSETAMGAMIDREEIPNTASEPTIAEMTNTALNVLDNDENGFFLMVESNGIKWGGEDHDPAVLVTEMVEFDNAVAIARTFVDANPDTLLIVTSTMECCGLEFTGEENSAQILAQVSSIDWMDELIDGGASVDQVVFDMAGIVELSRQDSTWISDNGTEGIGDAISRQMNVSWEVVGEEEYDPTDGNVPLYSYGAQADLFDGAIDNAKLGQMLFHAVSGSGPN